MEVLLSIIIGTVLFFYLFGIVGRFLLRLFINRKFRQFSGDTGSQWGGFAGQNQNDNQSSNYKGSSTHKEGEVFISKINTSEKRVKDKVGEYVDFEEVK